VRSGCCKALLPREQTLQTAQTMSVEFHKLGTTCALTPNFFIKENITVAALENWGLDSNMHEYPLIHIGKEIYRDT
jgi:hypothetical protein